MKMIFFFLRQELAELLIATMHMQKQLRSNNHWIVSLKEISFKNFVYKERLIHHHLSD